MISVLKRTIKWRLSNGLSIIVTILQPLLWLVLYGNIAKGTFARQGISDYVAYLTPGLLILVTFSASSSGGMFNYIMKRENSWKRLMISPLSAHKIILGQTLESSICALFEAGILWVISLLLGASYQINLVAVFLTVLLLFLAGLLFANIAYFFSLRLPNEVIYETVMNLVVLILFFLSSALIPQAQMLPLVSKLLDLNIFNHGIRLLRQLLLQGNCVLNEYIFCHGVIIVFVFLMIFFNSKSLKQTIV